MNTYKTFYKGKTMEVESDTSYHAQQLAAAKFKAKKSYDVTVVLIAKGETQVLVDPAQL